MKDIGDVVVFPSLDKANFFIKKLPNQVKTGGVSPISIEKMMKYWKMSFSSGFAVETGDSYSGKKNGQSTPHGLDASLLLPFTIKTIYKKERELGMRSPSFGVTKFSPEKKEDFQNTQQTVDDAVPESNLQDCPGSIDIPSLITGGLVFSENEAVKAILKAVDSLLDAQKYITESLGSDSIKASELNRVDHEISDELHFLEFTSVSASGGYQSAKRLRELRRKRREIKDMIMAARISASLLSLSESELRDIRDSLLRQDQRTYKLRVPETFQHPCD